MARLKKNTYKRSKNPAQLEFRFERPQENDRNYHLGGKSFYFFDFDDNVAYLSTPIVLFHKTTGKEIFLSSGDFAQHNKDIGKTGRYENYFIDFHDETGSFRYFRDSDIPWYERIRGKRQSFVEDVREALQKIDQEWKAPSWQCFYHATYNKRPMSVITARGHGEETIKDGINLMVKDGHLPHDPNYLSVFPVSNPNIRKNLGDFELIKSVADLKRDAIRHSVDLAIQKYGYSPYHRFGMSDDDPKNVELITEEMKVLKDKYPDMSFFVIQTFENSFSKHEVLSTKTRQVISKKESIMAQLSLFA